jgi:hypothetical protein
LGKGKNNLGRKIWSQTEEEQLRDFNLGTDTDPNIIHIGTSVPNSLLPEAEDLFRTFKDVFAWSFYDLRGISEHIAQHKIELDTSIPPTHQVHYRMNPNYAAAVKTDLDKLLQARFIEPVDHAT